MATSAQRTAQSKQQAASREAGKQAGCDWLAGCLAGCPSEGDRATSRLAGSKAVSPWPMLWQPESRWGMAPKPRTTKDDQRAAKGRPGTTLSQAGSRLILFVRASSDKKRWGRAHSRQGREGCWSGVLGWRGIRDGDRDGAISLARAVKSNQSPFRRHGRHGRNRCPRAALM